MHSDELEVKYRSFPQNCKALLLILLDIYIIRIKEQEHI